MNKYLVLALSFLPVAAFSNSALVIEGKYQNKNLYVQNAFASSGVGFCVFEVRVNGEVTTDEVNSSAFEIDLAQRNLKPGDNVSITIKHKDGCVPKVLNPDALKPIPTFETLEINLTPDGILNWKTKGEQGSLPYIVEQYKWNKWVTVGEVQGKGTSSENEYTFNVALISGENKFRVKQVGLNKKPRYSLETSIKNNRKALEFSYDKSKQQIIFTDETAYEIYDRYGNLVKKGFGKNVDITNLDKSLHYLNFDNQTSEFTKK
ncbi:MAG: hypothetical protein ACK4ON_12770 [Bacteroidia bacterium]